MATLRFTLNIRGGQENLRVPTHQSSSSSSSKFQEPGRQKKTNEELSASSLRRPFVKTQTTSQQSQRGSASNDWALWTVWSKDLFAKMDLYSEDEFVEFVTDTLAKEPIFERNEWEDLPVGDFILVEVSKDTRLDIDRPFIEGCSLRGQRLYFDEIGDNEPVDDKYYKNEVPHKTTAHVTRKHPTAIKLNAMGGLAEILATVVRGDDWLAICGGYINKASEHKVPAVKFNWDQGSHTQILRLPGYQFDKKINMAELIEPVKGEHRYRFTYGAHGRIEGSEKDTWRNVQQHRTFRYEVFGRNVLDSLACDEKKWDFPVPVVKDTAFSIYNSFISNDFSMFRDAAIPKVRERKVKRKVNLNETYNIPHPTFETIPEEVTECESNL